MTQRIKEMMEGKGSNGADDKVGGSASSYVTIMGSEFRTLTPTS